MMDPDWDYDSDHVMASAALRASTLSGMNATARRQWKEDEGTRWLAWNELPAPDKRKRIRALRLRVDYGERNVTYPTAIAKLPLEYLSLPLGLASKLAQKDLPSSLRALSFDESPALATAARIPTELVLPNVEQVSSKVGALSFARTSLPKLRSVSLALPPRSKMPDVLASYAKLSEVDVGPIHEPAQLAFLEQVGVETLSVVGGKLQTLSGFERLRKVKHLTLKSLAKLDDISSITALPKLRTIWIKYCGALKDLEPLLAVKTLREINVVSCKSIDLARVAKELKSKRFERVAVTGRRHLYRDGKDWVEKLR